MKKLSQKDQKAVYGGPVKFKAGSDLADEVS
jgi:hypothetical protein